MHKFITKIIIFSIVLSFFAMPAKPALAATLSRPPSNLGLVGYWPMNEGVGVKAGDISNKGYTGTLRNGISWSSGKHGGALSLDGLNDYVDVTDNSNLKYQGGNMTLSVWMKPDFAETDGAHFISKPWTGCGEYNYRLIYNSNKTIDLSIMGSAYAGISSAGAVVERGVWSQVVMTLDSSKNMKLYINGALVNSGTHDLVSWVAPSCGDSNLPLSIGTLYPYGEGWGGNTGFSFQGFLDDVRIYNRALSATEITKLYQSGAVKQKMVSNQGLVGYWPLNEGRGIRAGDSSGQNNHGTITGATWTNGKRGGALSFNGSSNWVNISNSTTLNQANFTAFAWFKTTSNSDQKIISNNISYHQLQTLNGHLRICVNGCTEGSTIVNDNKWHLAVVVGDATSIRAYLDGNSTAEITQSVSSNDMTGTFSIGKVGNGDSSYLFNGLIDDVRIYSRALSASEIQSLYKSGEKTENVNQNSKLTNGLVGLWSLNGQDVSGSTAYDRSGSGNNGTIVDAQVTGGKVGQALDFASTYKYVTANGPNKNTGLSLGAWIFPRQYPAERSTIILGNQYYLSLYTDGSLQSYWYGTSPEGYHATSAGKIPLNQWSHVFATWDGSKIKLYVNGVLETTVDVTGLGNNPAANSFRIGAESSGRQFYGKIDEARVYNRAISADEVKQLYNLGK